MTEDDQDDDTPRTQIATESQRHYARYPPGTPVADLVDQDLQQRMHVVERDVELQGRELASLTSSRRTWTWIIRLGAPVLLTFALGFVLYAADKISASGERAGETRAKIEALDKRVDGLQRDINTLQRDINTLILELRKLSGHDPRHGLSIVQREGRKP